MLPKSGALVLNLEPGTSDGNALLTTPGGVVYLQKNIPIDNYFILFIPDCIFAYKETRIDQGLFTNSPFWITNLKLINQ